MRIFRRALRKSRRGAASLLFALVATAIFAVYTGLLIYYAPMNHYLGIGLYVVGVVASSVPAFVRQPYVIAVSLMVTLMSFTLFLSSTFIFHL